ncbi:hypothetical protein GH5_01864 [Leishmania sp. Ghana 2012 LV757]|uniref:hypothetical protein n=1 Tax=Leishmania sp. Ghana 2012 LV757 TaxID=2803181 RepID=UPI001B5F5CFE|nr:hypothetical protein GH5_01864 [Leishmania sp. Ghana 2012 LV757]
MNYQVFSYMPSAAATHVTTSPRAADAPPRPIRVTPSALSALLYAILYSIEFQCPVGPRPPTLRDHVASRGSGSAVSTGAAVPTPTTLLTSAVSAMSSFWGRYPSTAQSQQPLQSQSQQRGTSFRLAAGATAAAFPGSFEAAPDTSARPLTLADTAELAALQRQHDQPFVVPVTQVLHKLGGVHITVRETHNPTITIAYNCVMEEIEALVSEHEQRIARLPTSNSLSFSSQALIGGQSNSTSATVLNSSAVVAGMQGENTADRLTRCGNASGAPAQQQQPRAFLQSPNVRQALPLPASPTSPSRSASATGSPTSDATAVTWGHGGSACSGGDDMTPGRDEVGMLLSVRLLSKEVTRWRMAHERPLAEWRFPIIRTSNERMIRPVTQSPAVTGTASGGAAADGNPNNRRDYRREGGPPSVAAELTLVNDPAQVHQVLEFILRSSYQTTSMETFTDFTSGELVFDAHVQEKHRFT